MSEGMIKKKWLNLWFSHWMIKWVKRVNKSEWVSEWGKFEERVRKQLTGWIYDSRNESAVQWVSMLELINMQMNEGPRKWVSM